MKVDSVISSAYASALLEAVKGRNVLAQAAEEAILIVRLLHENPRLQVILESPNVRDQEKLELVDRVFGPKFLDLLVRFMHLMLKRRRLENLVPSLELFRTLVVRAQGKREATFVTAYALTDAEKQDLEIAMERVTGHDLHSEYKVDPSVIGGVLFRCEDTLVDSTLQSGLSKMRRRLLRTQVVH
jgi:F-type H+-transporting ATPase subunit delta